MTTGGTKWLGNVIENRIKARRATKAKAADSKPGAVAREAETAAKTEIVVESANSGQEFLPKGYKPQPGERTFEGYVNSSVSKDKETKLFTRSSDFNTNPSEDMHFKRFGTKPNQHGIEGPHVHQPIRNVNPNTCEITGKPGSKTKNSGVTVPGARDVKQLYECLENGNIIWEANEYVSIKRKTDKVF